MTNELSEEEIEMITKKVKEARKGTTRIEIVGRMPRRIKHCGMRMFKVRVFWESKNTDCPEHEGKIEEIEAKSAAVCACPSCKYTAVVPW